MVLVGAAIMLYKLLKAKMALVGAMKVGGGLLYAGELQLMSLYKSSSILFADITDSLRFTCWKGAESAPVDPVNHPIIEFDRPQHLIRVHMEDRMTGRVLWDAVYNLHGTEELKSNAPPITGRRPAFWTICPPRDDPPHSYQLWVTKERGNFEP